MRLTGVIFFAIDASEPWVIETPSGEEIAPHLMPGVEHVIEYHVIATGSCHGGVVDGAPVRLEAGDIEVGMSRSVLVERFTHFVGIPPVH